MSPSEDFPEIQDGGQKKPEGQMLILIFKVKATVLSLLSCIFVMLNSQRLMSWGPLNIVPNRTIRKKIGKKYCVTSDCL